MTGHAIYTRPVLAIYDFMVLGVSNRWIWQCPTPRLVAHYAQHVTANHLDVGVGTGYFLDRCPFPVPTRRVALLDMNPTTLAVTARRIARYQPEIYQHNVLEPLDKKIKPFDSIGMNYLLHCLPGTIRDKAVVFDHLKTVMNPSAVLFGATLLQGGVPRSGVATHLMRIYNTKGIFSNQADDVEGLTHELQRRFHDVSVSIVGCAALFAGRA